MRYPRLYETVIERLRAYIADSNLTAGDRLPAERTLAERFGVSRVTVKQALIALQVQGLVQIRHGDGVFVTDPPPGQISARVERNRKLSDIIQARETIETEVAALAAIQRTEADLAAIAALLAEPVQFTSFEQVISHTLRFHGAVAAATHNAVLVDVVEHLVKPMTQVFDLHQAQPTTSENEHRAIYVAIRSGDPSAARQAMSLHLDHVSRIQMPTL